MAALYEQVREAGPFVFVAGQTPQDDSGDVPDDVERQVANAMAKINTLLAERGLSLTDVVKATYFLTDIADLAGVRAALDHALPQPRPTASLVEVSALVDPRFRIEIEVVAYRG
ncbi:MAG TPA: RidA family protein [Jatrophihabitantaceae bacterium]|nr:RidA family protein [Jatrophihabitantaceae bacterium]